MENGISRGFQINSVYPYNICESPSSFALTYSNQIDDKDLPPTKKRLIVAQEEKYVAKACIREENKVDNTIWNSSQESEEIKPYQICQTNDVSDHGTFNSDTHSSPTNSLIHGISRLNVDEIINLHNCLMARVDDIIGKLQDEK